MAFPLLAFGLSAAMTKVLLGVVVVAMLGLGGTSAKLWWDKRGLQKDLLEQKEQVVDLRAENLVLKDNNAILKGNMKKLAEANYNTYLTVKQILAEREVAVRSIKSLALATQAEKARLQALNKKIETMLKDAANDGEVAPILREIIREIEASRQERGPK